MKIEKKHWIIIGIVVAIILVWYFFLRKKKNESGYTSIPSWCGTKPKSCYSATCGGTGMHCDGPKPATTKLGIAESNYRAMRKSKAAAPSASYAVASLTPTLTFNR